MIVVVRVAEGTGTDEDAALAQTISNIIGTTDENGKYTGLKALLTAEAVTGVKPRILGVPGFDTLDVATALAPSVRSCAHLVMSVRGAVRRYLTPSNTGTISASAS